MPLPLPIQFTQQPGGIAGMYNALRSGQLENQSKAIENQYLPLNSLAKAASQLAYSSLTGPQFIAKLMGNESILANMPDEQKKAALSMLYNAGSKPTLQSNALNQVPSSENQQPTNQPFSEFLVNKLKNVFGSSSESKEQKPQNQMIMTAGGIPVVAPTQDINKIKDLSEGQSYTIPLSQGEGQQNSSYAENTGKYKGIVAEDTESGKIRAKDISDLNNNVINAENSQTTLDSLSKIVSSPAFEQIRSTPLAGRHELSYYSKFGTPEQQNMVGQYYTLTGQIIKDNARDFGGQFRKGEQQLLEGMKASPSDTVDVARGKIEALSFMNKMMMQRSKLVSNIMSEKHINKLQALEIADKQLNGDEIRQQIHDKLNPTVTIRNKKTGETMTIPSGEARTKYGVMPSV
jgi:hypothetical protein